MGRGSGCCSSPPAKWGCCADCSMGSRWSIWTPCVYTHTHPPADPSHLLMLKISALPLFHFFICPYTIFTLPPLVLHLACSSLHPAPARPTVSLWYFTGLCEKCRNCMSVCNRWNRQTSVTSALTVGIFSWDATDKQVNGLILTWCDDASVSAFSIMARGTPYGSQMYCFILTNSSSLN